MRMSFMGFSVKKLPVLADKKLGKINLLFNPEN